MIKKDRPTNIKEWHSDDYKRLCLFGTRRAMQEAQILVMFDAGDPDDVLLIHSDKETTELKCFKTMEEAMQFAESMYCPNCGAKMDEKVER